MSQMHGFQRLASQHIAGTALGTPGDVVRWMGALQAQDYHQAVWALGLRSQNGTLRTVQAAIEARQVIRTWPMRGTIHFVPAEDAKWMLQLSAARIITAHHRRLQQLDLTMEIVERSQELLTQMLSDGLPHTREALLEGLEQAGIHTDAGRGYHILWMIAQRGVICLGPMADKQPTFVLFDAWVPQSRQLSREEGLAELARRYFTSHGPATVQDYAWWVGITLTDARRGLNAIKSHLISETRDKKEYWWHESATTVSDAEAVYLLPGFDEYLLGYQDRSAVLAAEHMQQVVPGNNGVFQPMIVVGDQILGTWKRALKKSTVEITLLPLVPLDSLDAALERAAQAYADFVGLTLVLKRAER